MSYTKYKTQLSCLGPVAVRLGQTEVHAPEHATWGVVVCDVCGQMFAIGPNRTYGSRVSEERCVDELETKLAEEHKGGRPHGDHYEMPD